MKTVKWAAYLIGFILLSITLMVAASFGLQYFPVSASISDQRSTAMTQAYIQTNGVHTDFIFPLKNHLFDWTKIFPPSDLTTPPADAQWLAIGFGDREFYLNTPEWKDLTATTALGAFFGMHETLLHVTYLTQKDLQNDTFLLPINDAQYQILVQYVLGIARTTVTGSPIQVSGHYSGRDAFYAAKGRYHALNTCNVWVGDGLAKAGIKVPRWTPFESQVTRYLEPYKSNFNSQ